MKSSAPYKIIKKKNLTVAKFPIHIPASGEFFVLGTKIGYMYVSVDVWVPLRTTNITHLREVTYVRCVSLPFKT